jgi:geranylgeranyl pyrophosphate synthase
LQDLHKQNTQIIEWEIRPLSYKDKNWTEESSLCPKRIYNKGLYSMKAELVKNHEASYLLAEEKAHQYFASLYKQWKDKSFIPVLEKDFRGWQQQHIHRPAVLSLFSRRKNKPEAKSYHKYIKWLNVTGKLDRYLDRSISYIFMRDLGKFLGDQETAKSVREMAGKLKKELLNDQKSRIEPYSMIGLYQWAQKEGVEAAFIWVMDKINEVASYIPKEMDKEHAKRKLIKLIAGVVLNEIVAMGDDVSSKERVNRLDTAIRLGYCYGLTYPFIDDLLDAKVLTAEEESRYAQLIRTSFITGRVPEISQWNSKNKKLMNFVHKELKEAFEFIRDYQQDETRQKFLTQAFVFFHSQEVDRKKQLDNPKYSNEDLYIPIILKSASSRLIVHAILGALDEETYNRTFYYGIYNQLADDMRDMYTDLEKGAVTTYTYYLKYHNQRKDLINPFELYWTVIAHLIHEVYHSDPKTCEVILDRAINGLKRLKELLGPNKYEEVMSFFTKDIPGFNRLIQKMVRDADDVDFFDKLLRDHMSENFKRETKEQQQFQEIVKQVRQEINDNLAVKKTKLMPFMEDPITDAANYSLMGDGKRLRPIMTWVMGVKGFELDKHALFPLLRSLEYMHTASLIFDDLPSQDNSPTRRGRATLHEVYSEAIAELTGLFLTQKAFQEQASLEEFDAKTVLKLIRYSAQKTMDMCKGQAMDLASKGKRLSLEELNRMSFYKTGLGFEASLIMPAILSNASDEEMEALKKYAYHAGIAFQIKDDLLDVEGDQNLIGKPVGNDRENNSSTFVSILGLDGAKKAMWDHYCQAIDVLSEVPRNTTFLKQLLDYFINRQK